MTAEGSANTTSMGGGRATTVAQARPPVPLLNIANVLTMLRLALVPVFLVALFWEGGHVPLWRWIAAALFGLASITDRLDGDLARRWELVTDFGKIADPIADKALNGAALIGLSMLGDLAWWATLIIIARELLVTGLRFWVIRRRVIPASRGGKIKTLLQAITIGLFLLPLGGPGQMVRDVALGAALLATVLTGLDYFVQALRPRVESS
jgi:CDP-diacylglycerol--glycerol-3-phosphate 3-phosphatidyltransferase